MLLEYTNLCMFTDCTSGFVDLDRLKLTGYKDNNILLTVQRVFPAINFTCNGIVTEWTALAFKYDGVTGTERFPELQVWRNTENEGEYTRLASTTLTVSVTDALI